MPEFRAVMDIAGCTVCYIPLLGSHVVAYGFPLTIFIERDCENRIAGASFGILLRQNYLMVLLHKQRVSKTN